MTQLMEENGLMSDRVVYDYVFIGAGASNSLILLSMDNKGLLSTKKVLILDPDSKNVNDKTYCFWASPEDNILRDLDSIISYRYTNVEINNTISQNISQKPYFYIKSIDLYAKVAEVIARNEINVVRQRAREITRNGEMNYVSADTEVFASRNVFDSRPPSLGSLGPKDIYVNQSFLGFHIRTERDVFATDSFKMMDFNVDQDAYTQFVYILPFSPREALVELTRFGSEVISSEYAREVLKARIREEFGTYEVLGEEVGCIPMTTYQSPPSELPGVVHAGARGNQIKPSTGYGFKNMYSFAHLVTEKILLGKSDALNRVSLQRKGRFRFYDTILLIILLYWPQKGKKIFSQLFEKQGAYRVFSFLDEKTTLWQEVKIFALLPLMPFLRSLFTYLNMMNMMRYIVAALGIVVYFVLMQYQENYALIFGYFMIGIGVLSVGLPHGAVDHLLQKNKEQSIVVFILKYLFWVALYFVFWYFFPVLSILVFVAYSSFHFGESEIEEIGLKADSFARYVQAFMMGLSILMFIIFTHLEESLGVIASISGMEFIAGVEPILSRYAVLVYLASQGYLAVTYFVYRNASLLVLSVLLLAGTVLPLLFAFALYFVCQHSMNAWGHLKRGLGMNSMALQKESLPYTLGALVVFLGIAFTDIVNPVNLSGFLAGFFIFIACISFPHFIMMHLFYRKESVR